MPLHCVQPHFMTTSSFLFLTTFLLYPIVLNESSSFTTISTWLPHSANDSDAELLYQI